MSMDEMRIENGRETSEWKIPERKGVRRRPRNIGIENTREKGREHGRNENGKRPRNTEREDPRERAGAWLTGE
ncbi:unnamed protein product [Ectocarpus sp. CCAP 1310/34]|nr:unnamed protein product [Ectocarpus sp. CCAP 1310/34]